MKRLLVILIVAISLSSCERGCAKFDKKFQTGARDYEILMFSGGDTVFRDKVSTIINQEESSDGIYYYKGDTLVEVSGDYIVKSTK
jgi:hypothetical protein